VSDDGLVTAIAEGMAVITVTTVDGNHTATCEVNVRDIMRVELMSGWNTFHSGYAGLRERYYR
jgi:uncharacterized protein YjdB